MRPEIKTTMVGAFGFLLGWSAMFSADSEFRSSIGEAERKAKEAHPSISQQSHQDIIRQLALYTWAELTPEQENLFRAYQLIDQKATKTFTLRKSYYDDLVKKDTDTPVIAALTKNHLRYAGVNGGFALELSALGYLAYKFVRIARRQASRSTSTA